VKACLATFLLASAAIGWPGGLEDPLGLPTDPVVQISNSHMTAMVTPVIAGVRAGSLLELIDLSTGLDLAAGRQFGGVQCGPYVTEDGTVVLVSDSEALFSSPGLINYSTSMELPVETSIDYRLNGRGLEMTFTIRATALREIPYPLEVDFSVGAFDEAIFGNQAGTDRTVVYDGTHGNLRISGDQVVRLERIDGLLQGTFVFPNPMNAILATNDDPGVDSYLSLRFLDTEPPRENCAGPMLHSTVPPDWTMKVYTRLSLSPDFVPAYISAHPNSLERSGSWIFDDVPFRHDADSTWAFSETSSGPEYCSAELIQLLEDHPSLVMNWVVLADAILAPNCDSMWAEPGYEDSWSHWHSTWRICTRAPPDFLQWLRNIDQQAYPWAERVTLGSHGYHHTPSPDSAWDPFHEFITYQPEEHMERFRVIRQDFEAMGLDTTRRRAIRFPGHRTSLSGLYAIIRYGYDFYCNGVRWYETMGGEPFLDQYMSHYVTPDGSIWGSNTVWWGDYEAQYPMDYISTVLQRGKHALLGAHPSLMWEWGAPYAYARIDSICTSMEEDYPHFGWLLPEAYGEFMEETSHIFVSGIEDSQSQIAVSFQGQTSCGETMVVELPMTAQVQQVYIDGIPAAWTMHGPRLFAGINGLSFGDHTLVVDLQGETTGREPAGGGTATDLVVPSPFTGALQVCCSGLDAFQEVPVRVFDLAGRMVDSQAARADGAGCVSAALQGTAVLPSGLYFVHVGEGAGEGAVARAVKIH